MDLFACWLCSFILLESFNSPDRSLPLMLSDVEFCTWPNDAEQGIFITIIESSVGFHRLGNECAYGVGATAGSSSSASLEILPEQSSGP